ncbi:hypothetical protein B0T22DRAFT_485388 [Podospora appendiculata]|uniref:Uncharacterized protein n=1 Tax=Podospora appendiculata TaxID=314037 RepID=A0AAE1C790_9PEZI|nr:hypothetical protein B0T22DRAFT_485388 [Podospora appendiculata]
MPRSPPPAAINSAAASASPSESSSSTTVSQSSDLPLRNFGPGSPTSVPESIGLPPTPPQSTPGLSEAGSQSVSEVPGSAGLYVDTPSSTIVEFGDEIKAKAPSAVERVDHVFRSFDRSRSRSTHRDGRGSSSRSNTPTPRRPRSASRSASLQRSRAGSTRDRGVDEKVSRFLNSISHPSVDAKKELLAENRSLHQRVAALQRTERDLLKENQDLTCQLAGFRQHYETRRQQWKDEFKLRERAFEARVNEIEAQRLQLEERLLQMTPPQPAREPVVNVSDEDAIAWFTTRTKAWKSWADDFAHLDPHRVQTGLHPTQLQELCDGISSFVQLNEDGSLPKELLGTGRVDKGKVKATQILLHGMVTNFIVTETLHSPFWVFAAISACGLELESPCMPRANSMSPIGFRMDLAMWNNVAPLRSARLPPATLIPNRAPEPANGGAGSSSNPRNLPPLVTTPAIQPGQQLTLNTKTLQPQDLADQTLPSRQDMENLYGLLSNVQQNHNNTHKWRAQLMRMFCEGGIALDPESAKGEERRQLAEARLTYAKRLKDRFLSGPARFLLHDQDPTGIDRLERRLVNEIDLALRFSCQVWSRQDPLRFRGLQELSATEFKATSNIMELCPTQAPLRTSQQEFDIDSPPAYHDGHSVIMVVQPAIDSVNVTPEGDPGLEEQSTRWAKALVMVAEPNPGSGPRPSEKSASIIHNPTPTTAIGPSVPPKDLPELLPKVTFAPPPKLPSFKGSPPLPGSKQLPSPPNKPSSSRGSPALSYKSVSTEFRAPS